MKTFKINFSALALVMFGALMLTMSSCEKDITTDETAQISNVRSTSNQFIRALRAAPSFQVVDGMVKFNNTDDSKDFYSVMTTHFEAVEDGNTEEGEITPQEEFLNDLSTALRVTPFHSIYHNGDEYTAQEVDESMANPYFDGYITDPIMSRIVNQYGEVMIADEIYCFYDKDAVISYDADNVDFKEEMRNRDMFSYKNVLDDVASTPGVNLISHKGFFRNDHSIQPLSNLVIDGVNHFVNPYLASQNRCGNPYTFEVGNLNVQSGAFGNSSYVVSYVIVEWGDGNFSLPISVPAYKTNLKIYHTYGADGTYPVVVRSHVVKNGVTHILSDHFTAEVGNFTCSNNENYEVQWVYPSSGNALKCKISYYRNIFGKHVQSQTWHYKWKNGKWKNRSAYIRAGIEGTMRQLDCDDFSTKSNANFGAARYKQRTIDWSGPNRDHYSYGDLKSTHNTTNNYAHSIILDPCAL